MNDKYHNRQWPNKILEHSSNDIVNNIIERINQASSIWQQPGFFSDVILVGEKYSYFTDLPIEYAKSIKFSQSNFFTITLEYGKINGDIFNQDRVHKDNHLNGEGSKFLHPIIRHYKQGKQIGEHHIVEDLEAVWKDPEHIQYLLNFIVRELKPKVIPEKEDLETV